MKPSFSINQWKNYNNPKNYVLCDIKWDHFDILAKGKTDNPGLINLGSRPLTFDITQ